jgi:hypothetical protein
MLAHDVLDDLANEWQGPVCPFDGKLRHVPEVSVGALSSRD